MSGTFAAIAACATIDDIRARQPVWTAIYATPFDEMAACVAGRAADIGGAATPQVYPSKHAAFVTLTMPPYMGAFAEYEIKGTDGGTMVSFRHVTGGPGSSRPAERLARENADRCAKQS